jgi:hypothetical protein
MANNRKKKKPQAVHWNSTTSEKHSKSYLDTCFATARRIFGAIGDDPLEFDKFTKRQKQDIFRILVSPPRILAMPGHRVPRAYLRYVQEDLIMSLNRIHFNKEAGVTWMDMLTVGQTLMLIFRSNTFLESLPPMQREVADRLCKLFVDRSIFVKIQETILAHVKTSLLMLSQANFRIYGLDTTEQQPNARRNAMQQVVRITVHDCQSLRFKYHNRERTAYRLAMGQCLSTPFQGATIEMKKIYPKVFRNKKLNIYVQSHALHRFKERIDTFHPMMRNQLLIVSLMFVQRVVTGPDGTQLIACIVPCGDADKTIGYFAFTIDSGNLLVLTLLPLLSRNVPEGRVLNERLRLSPDDLKYLGMDKLSFFYEVDIAQIPALKQVLFDELHLDYIRKIYNSFHSKTDPFSEKRTLFVKNFFEKLKEQPADHTEVFDELADADM